MIGPNQETWLQGQTGRRASPCEDGLAHGVELLDRYWIERHLGQGAMGNVWLAFDRHAGVQVAIKTVIGPSVSAADQERARRNFQLVRQLTHPNVVALRQLELGPQGFVIVMDFVEGCDLQVYTEARGGTLALDEVLWIVDQTARGLDYAASLRIVHRDVKPANLLLGTGERLLIGDFGVATLATDEAGPAATLHRQVGTPLYMAPEQWLGAELDGRADQYALAAVTYRLLSGKPPFYDAERGGIDPRVFGSPPALLPQLRRRPNAALLKALRPRPEDRFESCEAFFRALSQRSGAVPVGIDLARAHPTPALPAPRRAPAARLLLLAALAAAIALGLLARMELQDSAVEPPPTVPPKTIPGETQIPPQPPRVLAPPDVLPRATAESAPPTTPPPARKRATAAPTRTPVRPAEPPPPTPDPKRFEDLLRQMPRIGEPE